MNHPVTDRAQTLRDQAINLMTHGGGGLGAQAKAVEILARLKEIKPLAPQPDKAKIQGWIDDVQKAIR